MTFFIYFIFYHCYRRWWQMRLCTSIRPTYRLDSLRVQWIKICIMFWKLTVNELNVKKTRAGPTLPLLIVTVNAVVETDDRDRTVLLTVIRNAWRHVDVVQSAPSTHSTGTGARLMGGASELNFIIVLQTCSQMAGLRLYGTCIVYTVAYNIQCNKM